MDLIKARSLMPLVAAFCIAGCNPGPPAGAPAVAATEDGRRERSPAPAQAGAAVDAGTDSRALQNAVDALLIAEYPAGFDEANRCWRTERNAGGETAPYCMRPLPQRVVVEGDGTAVYVALASASDITGDADYIYGLSDPGVMDAYRLTSAPDGTHTVTATGLGLPFGSAGDCGCSGAKFVQLGPHVHGWIFSSGATWQGTTVAAHSVLAPVHGAFKDVAGLPRFREGDQGVEYRLAVEPDTGTRGWYPIRLSRWREGKREATRMIAFDDQAARYPVPGDF